MNRSGRFALLAGAAGLGLLVFSAAPVQAAIISFDLDFEFSGGVAPSGPAPWINATFDDSFGGPNTVRLTMTTGGLTNNENVAAWYFNFDPSLDPTALTIVDVSSPTVGATTVSTGVNAFQADGDGLYDILFDFPPPPGQQAQRFGPGETVVYDLTYTSAITASSFDFLSSPAGGHGPFLTAAHIQQTGPNGNDSGWIAPGDGDVPEPASLGMLSVGLIGLGWAIGRRRRAA